MPGLTLVIRDERAAGTRSRRPTEEVFVHDGGISEFCEFLAPDPAVTDVWRLQGTGTFTETVPVLDAKGHMSPDRGRARVRRRHRGALGHRLRRQGQLVRQHHRHPQGRHPPGRLRPGPAQGASASQLELNARRLKVGTDKVEKDDVLAGLTAVVTVRLAEPQFEGQTKEVLGTNAVRAIVAKVVETRAHRAADLDQARREGSRPALLLEKVVSEMKSRISARLHKETQRRKTALESSTLPAKLADCRSTDVERTELFIVEGDSALGTAKLARGSDYQALLPIRGKILNVQKASVTDMLKNAECAAIIQVIGAGSGRTFDLDVGPLRQGHHHDRRRRRRRPHPHPAAHPVLPLHAPARRGRPGLCRGAAAAPHRGDQRRGRRRTRSSTPTPRPRCAAPMASLAKRGKNDQEPLQRYKGLGEMDADQLAETTMDPRHRTLRKVTAGRRSSPPQRVFELLMGGDVGPRKDFIIDSAARPRPRAHRRLSENSCAPKGAAGRRPPRHSGPMRTSPDVRGGAGEGTMSASVDHDERPVEGEEQTELKRAIGPKLLLLFIVGDILGTGVYALTGQVAERGRRSGLGCRSWWPSRRHWSPPSATSSWSPSTRRRPAPRSTRTRRSASTSSRSSSPSP